VVQAERAVEAAVGQAHLGGAERADVPVDAEALLEREPVVPERRLVAHLRHDGGREAQVYARAEAGGERDRVARHECQRRHGLQAREAIGAVPHLREHRDVHAGQSLHELGHLRDRVLARGQRALPEQGQLGDAELSAHGARAYSEPTAR
jgi:hypothetical protein